MKDSETFEKQLRKIYNSLAEETGRENMEISVEFLFALITNYRRIERAVKEVHNKANGEIRDGVVSPKWADDILKITTPLKCGDSPKKD